MTGDGGSAASSSARIVAGALLSLLAAGLVVAAPLGAVASSALAAVGASAAAALAFGPAQRGGHRGGLAAARVLLLAAVSVALYAGVALLSPWIG